MKFLLARGGEEREGEDEGNYTSRLIYARNGMSEIPTILLHLRRIFGREREREREKPCILS
jgi:hypothetical protein